MREENVHFGPRITVAEAARITGRAERTWHRWLKERHSQLTVVYGRPQRDSRAGERSNVRWLDIEEVYELHMARGGTTWNISSHPAKSAADRQVEADTLPRSDTDVATRVSIVEAHLSELEYNLETLLCRLESRRTSDAETGPVSSQNAQNAEHSGKPHGYREFLGHMT